MKYSRIYDVDGRPPLRYGIVEYAHCFDLHPQIQLKDGSWVEIGAPFHNSVQVISKRELQVIEEYKKKQ